ncbi:uncharacterized protein LOC141602121 [Silene latifolia]|uniref:uncharacterized protein LOC141602121 n=1 Tax=Silene latifolia TaxID=37657 RepID=UPI003D779454
MAELLGKTAQAILDEDEIYTVVPPPDFRSLLERTFVAKIRINQLFNIEQKSNSYGVISLCNDPRTIVKWDAMNNARKEQTISTSTRDTTNTDSMMEQMREIVESEPVQNSEEITPHKGVELVTEASDKSSATKLKEIKMGKQPQFYTSNLQRDRLICSPTDVVERLVRDICAEYGEAFSEVNPSVNRIEQSLGSCVFNASYSHGESSRTQQNTSVPLNNDAWEGYWDCGDGEYECEKCHALMWFEERKDKRRGTRRPNKFSLCFSDGKVELPFLQQPPELIKSLTGQHRFSKHYRENIRTYNSIFSFTSIGGKIDHSINQGRGPYTFRMGGQNCHRIGPLVPTGDARPKFCQLYIYDTEEEVHNRKNAISPGDPSRFNDELIRLLENIIDSHNTIAKIFRKVRDRLTLNTDSEVSIKLISRRSSDGRTYNLPTVSQVAALIEGDIGPHMEKRDIIVRRSCGGLQRISELHPLYTPLQYHLLIPSGEDGYRPGILHSSSSIGVSTSDQPREETTCREWFAYHLIERPPDVEFPTILLSGKAFYQFLVDCYMLVESHRLNFIRFNQDRLRVDSYKNLSNAVGRGDVEPSSAGIRFIVPSSFPEGDKWKKANVLDTMTICKWFDYPNLFITFTCNPKWPKIVRFVSKRGLRPEDRPDIVCRVFKMKLDELIRDLKDRHIFGRARGVVYTIEFQKRGLPHAHIVLFLHRGDKFPTAADVDKIISAEIPDPTIDPVLHSVVCEYMLHEPCDKQPIVFHNDDWVDEVVENTSLGVSQFLNWIGYNNSTVEEMQVSKELLYCEFPTKFVWKKKVRQWSLRKKGFTIGRLDHVPPQCGELYFMRVLLNHVKGPKCFEDIRSVNDFVHPTFREACYALGLIGDDREYIVAINEAVDWGSGFYLTNLFATLLFCGTLSIPIRVWDETWQLLSDDILHRQHTVLNNQDNIATFLTTDLLLTDEELQNYALIDIEKGYLMGILQTIGVLLKILQTLI